MTSLFHDKKGRLIAVVSHSSPRHAEAGKIGLDTISCRAVLERSACAPFIKESRMELSTPQPSAGNRGKWATQPLKMIRLPRLP